MRLPCRRAAGPWVALAALACACGRSELRPQADLAALLPVAVVRREPGVIRPGTPAALAYLGDGWAAGAEGADSRWSEGDRSELRFELLAARDLELAARARPFSYPGAPPQRVEVEVNGRRVGVLDLPAGTTTQRILLPGRLVREGENHLLFRYAWQRTPRELGLSSDRRRLAVAWHELAFVGAVAPREGSPRVEGGTLRLPAGQQLDYGLDLAPGSVLRIEGISFRGAGEGRVEVYLALAGETADGEPRLLARWGRGGAPPELALPGAGVARLSLRALADGSGPAAVDLVRPVLWAPAGPAPANGGRPRRGGGAEPERGPRLNVVVYLVDTLRADHLGCYGYGRPTSARLDRFARDATLFETAIAQSSWTRSSTASVLTGLWPYAHGANLRRDRLAEEAVTLAERLKGAGYRTGALVANPNVARNFGFAQGFEEFAFERKPASSAQMNRWVFDWLDRHGRGASPRDGGRPFFLYVHTVDPHDPYDPPAAERARLAPQVPEAFVRESKEVLKGLIAGSRAPDQRTIEWLLALYDAEIAANDASFGALLDRLQGLGRWEDTLILFVSDHGEEFHEHGGWTHGRSLEAELVNVPLLMRLPGRGEGRRVKAPVQHIDLVPTVLAAVGLAVPAGLEGESLVPLLDGGESGWEPRSLFTYLRLDQVGRPGQRINHRAGLLAGEWKLTQVLGEAGRGRARLYRWPVDRADREDLAGHHPVRVGYLQGRIARRLGEERPAYVAAQARLDPEIEASLRALGYVP